MKSKISKLISEFLSMFSEFGGIGEKVESIIDSCKTQEQLESCRNMVSNIEKQMSFKIERFIKNHRIANILTFGEIEKSLNENIGGACMYLNRKISEKYTK